MVVLHWPLFWREDDMGTEQQLDLDEHVTITESHQDFGSFVAAAKLSLLCLIHSSSLISKSLYFQFSHYALCSGMLISINCIPQASFFSGFGCFQLMGGISSILERGGQKAEYLTLGFFLARLQVRDVSVPLPKTSVISSCPSDPEVMAFCCPYVSGQILLLTFIKLFLVIPKP